LPQRRAPHAIARVRATFAPARDGRHLIENFLVAHADARCRREYGGPKRA
jgi:hypothetical protein